jgi:4-hydroxy-tetrahydrodipicolinate reductase
MGRALVEEIMVNSNCEISGGVVRLGSEFVGMDIGVLAGVEPVGINATASMEVLFDLSDAVIDFSNPAASIQAAKIASSKNKIHIIGTTGFSPEEIGLLVELAEKNVVVWSANMSVGVNILLELTRQVAAILDDSYDIEIVEMHHCRKVDAPSGTALALGNSAAAGRKVALSEVAMRSRDGIIGARPRGEIGFATLRGGDVVGEHSVIFAGDGERIELTHKASNRRIFSRGAVRAALWGVGKKPGLYSMGDVLGLNAGAFAKENARL